MQMIFVYRPMVHKKNMRNYFLMNCSREVFVYIGYCLRQSLGSMMIVQVSRVCMSLAIMANECVKS